MPIAYQTGRTSKLETTATSMTVDMPNSPSVSNGEFMVMYVYASLSGGTVTVSGWTSLGSTSNTNGRMSILYRFASSEPASYTANFGASVRAIVSVHSYSGVPTDLPIVDWAITSISGTNALTTAAKGGKRQGSWILSAAGCRTSPDPGPSFTTSDGSDSERSDVTTTGGTSDNRPGMACYDSNRIIGVAGTSTRTFTHSGTRLTASGLVAILELSTSDPVTTGDTGSGTDSASVFVTEFISSGDTGSGTESESVVVISDVSDGDTGSGAESASVEVIVEDFGSSSESGSTSSLTPNALEVGDTGSFIETETREVVSEALAVWLPSVNAPAPEDYFHWGSVAAGSSEDKSFRVKNISLASRAIGVTVTLFGSGSGSANPANLHLLSKDGIRFTASLELEDLAPGELSELLTLRRVIPYAASLGIKNFAVRLTVNEWAVEFWPSYPLVAGP